MDPYIRQARRNRQVQVRRQRNLYHRVNPLTMYSDNVFKANFRFSKQNFNRLLNMIEHRLQTPNNRGNPLSPAQQLAICLHHYGGAPFQRTCALAGGVCQTTVFKHVHKVSEAILELKLNYIHWPSREMLEETAARMQERYNIRDLGFGVDGMMVYFDGAPRDIPEGYRKQHFRSRRDRYALNVQVNIISLLSISCLAIDEGIFRF